MVYNAAQQWRQTQFQILVYLPNWYIQFFLVNVVVEILIAQTLIAGSSL